MPGIFDFILGHTTDVETENRLDSLRREYEQSRLAQLAAAQTYYNHMMDLTLEQSAGITHLYQGQVSCEAFVIENPLVRADRTYAEMVAVRDGIKATKKKKIVRNLPERW